MKKSILILSLVLGLTIGATAQEGSGLFKRGEAQEEENAHGLRGGDTPGLPGHGHNTDQPAPLGGGALLLIGFGAAYAMSKRNKN